MYNFLQFADPNIVPYGNYKDGMFAFDKTIKLKRAVWHLCHGGVLILDVAWERMHTSGSETQSFYLVVLINGTVCKLGVG